MYLQMKYTAAGLSSQLVMLSVDTVRRSEYYQFISHCLTKALFDEGSVRQDSLEPTGGMSAMARTEAKEVTCPICQKTKPGDQIIHGYLVRPTITALIQKIHSSWTMEEDICLTCLNDFRGEYVEDVLEMERGELSRLEEDVVQSYKEFDLLSSNINKEFERQLTFGEQLADRIATFGGSWRFIMIFGGFIFVWVAVNAYALLRTTFDPYPYILLNLILSCLAALQAPVIMMSQNRLEDRDRLRSENDYRVNLKAELEIRHLNEKLDLLLTNLWQRLLEIQKIQMEIMRGPAEGGNSQDRKD